MKTEKDRKQANIQGIHCIIETTTGNRRWGLGEFFVFLEKEFIFHSFPVLYFLACTLYLSIYLHPSVLHGYTTLTVTYFFLCISTSHTVPQISLLNIQNTSPQQPQHIKYIALRTLRPKITVSFCDTVVMLIYCFFKVFRRHLEPQED